MDKKTAQNLIEDTFNEAFDEGRFQNFAQNLLNDIEPRNNAYAGNLIWDDYKEHINTYKRIGKYTDPDGEALDVLMVEVKTVQKLERARTSLRNFVIKHLSKFEKDYALVAFYSKEDGGADWRFSFIKLEYRSELDEIKGKVKTKKEFTPAKRYSFLVGKYEKAYTAKNQLLPLLQNISNNPTIEELEAAFSIEKVTDEFFNQYKDLYIKLYEHFENDRKVKAELKNSGIDNARFTKKLLGQIVFLYFLQKKGWLGVAQNARWGTGRKRFVQELFEQAQNKKLNFFKDKLQYLFYEALAKERDNVNSYYKRFDCRIPFLNGGLFEADYNWQEANISIPESLFRNEEKNKSGDVGTGILDVFDRYNFTIKEDEPLDKEVAVDPEMLGKVFENMLDITERKSKGAFYTPREIVHYMCQESLIHYLDNALNDGASSFQELGSDQPKLFGGSSNKKGQTKLEIEHKGNIQVRKKDIETFIREGHFALENDERVAAKGETKTYQYQLPESIREHADLIDRKLSDIKICDPAIGSGAFPVGLLHELVNAMLVLKPHLGYDYLTEKLKGFGFKHRESISDSRYIYRLKRHIIQESIYGVDIDSSAIDIARLRLWLSLVVDEDDLDPIETLPNLDYKIVCGNSLIGLPDGAMRDLKVEAELETLKEEFYDITDEKEKKTLRKKINTKIRELLDSAEQFAGYKIDFDFKLFFSEVWREKGGFDVVIGNPPYVFTRDVEFENDFKKVIAQNFFTKLSTNSKQSKANQSGKINLFAIFLMQSLVVSKRNGITSLILPNNILRTTTYDKIRKFLLDNYSLHYIADLGEGVFKNVTASTAIIAVTNTKASNHKCEMITNVEDLSNLKFEAKFIEQNSFLKNVSYAFNVHIDELSQGIINKINYKAKLFGEFCIDIIEGIVAHKALIHSNKVKNSVPLVEGKMVKRYYLQEVNKFLEWEPDKIHRTRPDYLWQAKKKIVIQRISGGLKPLVATLDTEKHKTFASTNNILLKNEYNKFYYLFTAMLNSDVLNWYYSTCFSNRSKLTVNISKTFTESLPVKETTLILDEIINYCLQTKNDSNANEASMLFFQEVINSAIYELYFPEEIKSAGKEILKHLGDLKPITDDMSEEKKLAIIQSEFERLYDPNHPVRFAIETLDSVEEVRIIKEALK